MSYWHDIDPIKEPELAEAFERIWNDDEDEEEEESEMQRIYENKERALEPPEPSVWCECDVCGLDIYEGEEFWRIDEKIVCNDCLRPFAEEYFKNCRETAKKERED